MYSNKRSSGILEAQDCAGEIGKTDSTVWTVSLGSTEHQKTAEKSRYGWDCARLIVRKQVGQRVGK